MKASLVGPSCGETQEKNQLFLALVNLYRPPKLDNDVQSSELESAQPGLGSDVQM